MGSTAARRRLKRHVRREAGWVYSDARDGVSRAKVDLPSPPTAGDTWLDLADQHFNHPGNAVVVAIGRQKIRYTNGRDDCDLLAGYTGDDSAPDITDEMERALEQEDY